MVYYRICPYCEAHLDPEERCDCGESSRKYTQKKSRLSGPVVNVPGKYILSRKGGLRNGYKPDRGGGTSWRDGTY